MYDLAVLPKLVGTLVEFKICKAQHLPTPPKASKSLFRGRSCVQRHILQQIFLNLQRLFIGECVDAPHHVLTKIGLLAGGKEVAEPQTAVKEIKVMHARLKTNGRINMTKVAPLTKRKPMRFFGRLLGALLLAA